MIKTIVKWLILLTLLCYIAIAVTWTHEIANARICKGVEVEIAENSTSKFVTVEGVMEKISDISPNITSFNLSDINTEEIECRLAEDNSFESVECYLTSDDKLRIEIVPMVPELRVFDSNGESYYINKDGKRIDAGEIFFIDAPVVRGAFDFQFKPDHIFPVSRYIQADKELVNLITMIEAKDPHNILLYPCIKGHVINIGDTTNLPDKFERLMIMYHQVMPYKGWHTYDTISVKFRNQIVATRKDKSKRHAMNIPMDSIDPEEHNLIGLSLEPVPDQTDTDSTDNPTVNKKQTTE